MASGLVTKIRFLCKTMSLLISLTFFKKRLKLKKNVLIFFTKALLRGTEVAGIQHFLHFSSRGEEKNKPIHLKGMKTVEK